MEHGLRVGVLPEDAVDELAVADVALDERDRVGEPLEVQPRARPDEAVEDDDVVAAVGERTGDVRADEPGSARDDPLPAAHPHRDTIRSMIALVQAAPAYGAIERYLARIAAGLDEEAMLVFPDVPELVPFRELPVRLEPLPRTTLESAPRALAALARLFRELRPRLVHVNDPFPPAVLAARLARVPRVLLTHHTPELPRRDNTIGR